MSCSKWAYAPERCDSIPCPGDCDECSCIDYEEPDDAALEMGFNPYEGCYDFDC